MAELARQGAFHDCYVHCDASTTTSNDINLGKCNAIIAIAPVKAAEFIILYHPAARAQARGLA